MIGQITVDMPNKAAVVRPQFTRGDTVPGTGFLLGYNMDRETMAPGDEMLLTLFWERDLEAVNDRFVLQLVDDGGKVVQTWDLPVTRADFNLSEWEAGQVVRGQHLLRLAASLNSGTYTFRLAEDVSLGQVVVTAPERIFEEPDVGTTVDILFADTIKLVGYTLAGDPLQVELVWSAMDQIDSNYHVFVHLVDENGAIVAQSDGQPADWTRPTAGWAPGEYIVDSHTLTLPQGMSLENLSLRVGLYDPDTGSRLPVQDAEFVTLLPKE